MDQSTYKKTIERLKKGEKMIKENGGFLNGPKKWIDEYQLLAEQCLLYETIHNLLPI